MHKIVQIIHLDLPKNVNVLMSFFVKVHHVGSGWCICTVYLIKAKEESCKGGKLAEN